MRIRNALIGALFATAAAVSPAQAWIFAHTTRLQGYRQPPDGIIRLQDMKLAR